LQTCKSGDDNLPDEDSIRRIQGRRGHLALAKSGSGPGEYRCQYVASFAPNVPFARNSRLVDEDAYEICRDQIRLRHTILGIADECTTN
jgi:hypothetical protein